jgi:8-oxo-dGTP pyrophosphatase MutT (NUDIX family)
MLQKYKVFIDKAYIVFSDVDQSLPNWTKPYPNSYRELVSLLQNRSYQLVSKNPKEAMISFFAAFQTLQTAGGLVQQDYADAFLWIYRFGHLDLPKGKIEKEERTTEAAIREIEEETGLVGQFETIETLPCTYHVYEQNGLSFLKQNHWFCFRFSGLDNFQPQIEEGITHVFWLTAKEWRSRLNETYPGIRELLTLAC